MRRIALLLLTGIWLAIRVAAAQTPDCAAPAATDDGWAVADPVSVGLDPAVLCAVGPRFDAWKVADVHAVLVVRDGKLVFERYFPGYDEHYGQIVSNAQFNAETLHDAGSVTKSITALVLGIAVGHHWIVGIDQPVLPFFPEYADLRSPEKDRITIRDLLMISAGLKWNGLLPYSDPANSERAMSAAADPYRYTLDQPVEWPPGTVYNYTGGGATLIAANLHKATGRSLEQLAHAELFTPLRITDVTWYHFLNGDPRAASGLRMRPRDMAKIG